MHLGRTPAQPRLGSALPPAVPGRGGGLGVGTVQLSGCFVTELKAQALNTQPKPGGCAFHSSCSPRASSIVPGGCLPAAQSPSAERCRCLLRGHQCQGGKNKLPAPRCRETNKGRAAASDSSASRAAAQPHKALPAPREPVLGQLCPLLLHTGRVRLARRGAGGGFTPTSSRARGSWLALLPLHASGPVSR